MGGGGGGGGTRAIWEERTIRFQDLLDEDLGDPGEETCKGATPFP